MMLRLESLKAIGFKRLQIVEPFTFPQGRLLIHGANESGKSTILEAIHYALYGMGLRPDRRASNDDLINYDLPEAVVELKFSIDENSYLVKRVLKRDKTNVHSLEIEKTDGKRERITGARDVNNAILEDLHGIDSDALLNSCLVEQKELDKLEDATRSERIRCMTSLLNLETFVDASDELKKARRTLEREHETTLNLLKRAERAKELYERAEERLDWARERIDEIKEEMNTISNRIKIVDEKLEIIEEVKRIDNDIRNNETRIQGLQAEIRQIEQRMEEAEKAEKKIQEIERKLPAARKALQRAKEKTDALEELIQLEANLKNQQGELERTLDRIQDLQAKAEESREASERVEVLRDLISKYKFVEEARNTLSEIEAYSSELESINIEIERLEEKRKDLISKMESLREAKRKLDELNEREEKIKTQREEASTKRGRAIPLIIIGGISIAGLLLNPLLLIPGMLLLLAGIYLYIRNDPSKFEPMLEDVRSLREGLLGDKARVEEYGITLEELSGEQEKLETRKEGAKKALGKEIEKLPNQTRSYAKIISVDENLQQSISNLREMVNEDDLTRREYIRELEWKKSLASQFEERRDGLDAAKEKRKQLGGQLSDLENRKEMLEKEYGISTDFSDDIRSDKDHRQRQLNELESGLRHNRELVENKEEQASSLREKRGIMEAVNKELEELRIQKGEMIRENQVEVSNEKILRSELDELTSSRGQLQNERDERQGDIRETQEVLEENKELNGRYPEIVEQDRFEDFDLKAMDKAIILLDTTRDGIIGGVKGWVEANMVRFLPPLTENRYHTVRIDEKDYRIEVYDKNAKRWRGKGIFSGATQDQFSLALRLSFALSTIPSSRGARPGFIFLDEPLSGFDTQRRQGFLELLKGEIARHFEQVIVISHLEELKEEFPNSIQLEAGSIIQTI
jgi:exonuclease SbcC